MYSESKLNFVLGGAIGYVSFDCIGYFEPKTARQLKSYIDIPESVFLLCDTILVFDHLFQTLKVVSHVFVPSQQSSSGDDIATLYQKAQRNISNVVEKLLKAEELPLPKQGPVRLGREGVSNVGKEGYEAFVTKMREHIIKGDIIQAVPSQRIRRETDLHPFNVYRYVLVWRPPSESRIK
jgi:anthranilate synthase component 1